MNHVSKLLEYLNKLGNASYLPYRFDNETNYATIEFTTDQEIAEGLERHINDHCKFENGDRAYMRFIAVKKIKYNDRYLYVAEIVPFKEIPKDELEEATEELLRRLPHLIKDFRKKYHGR